MSTEIRNWDVVAKALEVAGNTSSEMYIRAKALALGKDRICNSGDAGSASGPTDGTWQLCLILIYPL